MRLPRWVGARQTRLSGRVSSLPIFIGKLTPPDTGRDRAEAAYAVVEAQSRADAINAFRRLGTNGAVQVVKGAATADWIAKAKRTRGVALLGAEVVEAPEVS